MLDVIQAVEGVESATAGITPEVEQLGPKIKRRYRRVGREHKPFLDSLRDYLINDLQLYREEVIFKKSGGRSGDLAAETLEYEVFLQGRENGWNEGAVYVYSVVDDSCNGYAQHFSVLVSLPAESEVYQKLLEFLESSEFVSSHSSFKERPYGWHSFRAYLDAIPSLELGKAFGELRPTS